MKDVQLDLLHQLHSFFTTPEKQKIKCSDPRKNYRQKTNRHPLSTITIKKTLRTQILNFQALQFKGECIEEIRCNFCQMLPKNQATPKGGPG